MSALARYFNSKGYFVAGYDKTETSLTQSLSKEGIVIHYEDSLQQIPGRVFQKENTIIIYTPAIPNDHGEWKYFKENQFNIYKRAEVLGLISNHSFCIAVAGTHGKTTTSSLITHMLKNAGLPVTGFLGGITVNYGTNYITSANSSITVVEADEFDRSFLHLSPDIAVINSVEADHLDIYGDENHVHESFYEFTSKIKNNGKLFISKHVNIDLAVKVNDVFGVENGSVKAINIEVKNGCFRFDIEDHGNLITDFEVQIPGRHNIENSLAAYLVGKSMGLSEEQIKTGLRTFKGVKRRFENIVSTNTLTYIDDYAHHPTEIAACLSAAKEFYPNKKISVIFQPHLYSRTRDFANQFAQSLNLSDYLILLPIYPARELPIDGINSNIIFEKVDINNKVLINKSELLSHIKDNITNFEVLITMGAGDIDSFIEDIKRLIQNSN